MSEHMKLYEVFIRSRRGLDHKHVGSLHAEDAAQALEYARDVYTRRSEGVSIWVVNSSDVVAVTVFTTPWTTSPIVMQRTTSCLTKSTTCEGFQHA